jgi:hypothetical protein
LALRRKGIATTFSELRCTFGGKSIVPDLAVFENHRVPNNDGKIKNVFTIAPDWTIDESKIILPVPGFAAAIELSIEQMFKWLDLV